MKLVSIIVPIYNVEDYLQECVESLINQTYKKIEIILVNDGSTDNSLKTCNKYAKIDKRVKIINQENSGHGVACNAGINNAIGDYLFFCDGDDFLLPNAIKHLVEAMEKTKADAAICTAYAFDNKTKKTELDPYHSLIKISKKNQEDTLNKKDLLDYSSELSVRCWDKIYNLKWLKKQNILFPKIKTSYDDVPFHWLTLSKISKMAIVREQLYAYRLNRVGSSYHMIKQAEYFNMRKIAMEIVAIQNQDLLNEFYKVFIADMSWIKKLEKPIEEQFFRELKKALNRKGLSKETKLFIKQYFQRQSFTFKFKEKIKKILFVLKH